MTTATSAQNTERALQLRYAATCADCGCRIPAGTWALWNGQTKKVRHWDSARECGVEGQQRAYREAVAQKTAEQNRRFAAQERREQMRRRAEGQRKDLLERQVAEYQASKENRERDEKRLQAAAAALMEAEKSGDADRIAAARAEAAEAMRVLGIWG